MVEYRADGTFTASGNLQVEGVELPDNITIPTNASGTYQFTENQLTLTVTQPPLPNPQPVTVTTAFSSSNNTMTISTTQDGITVTTTFTRL
jgi:hypothetical protein